MSFVHHHYEDESAKLTVAAIDENEKVLSPTMPNISVKDLSQTIKVKKTLTWSERRAKYIPNMDAASIGFGITHPDYNRYLSPWNQQSHHEQAAADLSSTKHTTSSIVKATKYDKYGQEIKVASGL